MDPLLGTVGRSVSVARSISRGKLPIHTTQSNRRDFAIGVGLLLLVVFLWTSSNFVTQDLFVGGYEKPFIVTYLNTSSFALYLIPFFTRRWASRPHNEEHGHKPRPRGEYQPLVTEDTQEDINEQDSYVEPSNRQVAMGESELPPLSTSETAQLAFVFCFLWFIANWSVNASLNYTSVASATILTSMSGFFTLGFGRIFHVERFTLIKVFAVFVSFMGVILVSLSDSVTQPASDHTQRAVLGDFLALVSAVFYALYVILLKVRIRSESRIDMQLFFGFVGLFNILCCWPIGLVLHIAGIEIFGLPATNKAWAAIIINMAITLSSDYLYVLAMLKTTPLVVTVGLSLTIPLAVIGDFMLKRPTRGQVIFGAILVLISFVTVGLDNPDPEQTEDKIIADIGRGRSGQGITRAEDEVELAES
ncbi:hypothetical protein BDQ12DRAFT_600688 [Crucibulum laeve]|uniref:EamA domain-containing protein n=1 Tax=Crucibulum laeve TaxID=68775 RepID=A0A5C3M9C7_9AGAR|nr:hypothetical protein BDQ12DRAFT_600688 [Crucibulum laeve]